MISGGWHIVAPQGRGDAATSSLDALGGRTGGGVAYVGDAAGIVHVWSWGDAAAPALRCDGRLPPALAGPVSCLAACDTTARASHLVAASFLGDGRAVGGVAVIDADADPSSHRRRARPSVLAAPVTAGGTWSVAWLDVDRLAAGGAAGAATTGAVRVVPSGALVPELLVDMRSDAFCVSRGHALDVLLVGTRAGGLVSLDTRARAAAAAAPTPLLTMRSSVVAVLPLTAPLVLVADADAALQLHDLRAPRHALASFPGYANSVKRLGLAVLRTDGPATLVAAASRDGAVRLWNHRGERRACLRVPPWGGGSGSGDGGALATHVAAVRVAQDGDVYCETAAAPLFVVAARDASGKGSIAALNRGASPPAL